MSAAAPVRERDRRDGLLVAAALLLSLATVWLASGEVLVAGGFAAGLIALGALAFTLTRRQPAEAEAEFALPDWSVTVTAISRPDAGVAVTDRANRLVCANPRYTEWFGADDAPPYSASSSGRAATGNVPIGWPSSVASRSTTPLPSPRVGSVGS